MTEEKETLEETTPEAQAFPSGEGGSGQGPLTDEVPAAADSKFPLKASLSEGATRKANVPGARSQPKREAIYDCDPGCARRAEGVMADEASPTGDEAPELDRLRAELESVRGQVTRLEHERYLLSRGVPEEDLDYYAFKIEHMEGAKSDFRKAAKEYLKAHPVRRTAVSSGADLTAGSTRRPATSSELMNQLLRNH